MDDQTQLLRAIIAAALVIAAYAPAGAQETVTYTDAKGVTHTTSSKAQIECERDRGGHYTLSGTCEAARQATRESENSAISGAARSAEAAGKYSRAVVGCARLSGAEAYTKPGGRVEMLGTATARFDFQRCMQEREGIPLERTGK